MEQEYNFEALRQNLMDVMKEAQIKLGYSKNATRQYYPLDSVNRLLDTQLTAEELDRALNEFSVFVRGTLGSVECSRDGELICFAVPAEGAEYVHEKAEDSGFLRAFIETICRPCTIEQIRTVFETYSNCVRCERIDNDEFDYLMYFEDGKPDNYRYCIKCEPMHTVYHRFTPKDYEAFGF